MAQRWKPTHLSENSRWSYSPEQIEEIIQDMENYLENNSDPIPSFNKWADNNGIPPSSIKLISLKNAKIANLIEQMQNRMGNSCLEAGMGGECNPSMAIFACRVAGLRDTQQVEIRGQDPIVIKDEDGKPLLTLGTGEANASES